VRIEDGRNHPAAWRAVNAIEESFFERRYVGDQAGPGLVARILLEARRRGPLAAGVLPPDRGGSRDESRPGSAADAGASLRGLLGRRSAE